MLVAPTVRPQARLTQQWVRDTPLGTSTLGAVLDQQVRLRLVGSGALAGRVLVGETPAAQALLAGPDGAKLQGSLRGMLGRLDGEAGAVQLAGIDFASDEYGFYANEIAAAVQAGDIGATGPGEQWNRDVASVIAQWKPTASRDIPMCNYVRAAGRGADARVELAPRLAKTLLDLVHDPKVSYGPASPWQPTDSGNVVANVFGHELRHAVTPATESTWRNMSADYMGAHVNWLEEGATQALTLWPGALTRDGAALGVPVDEARAPKTWAWIAAQMPTKTYAELPPYPKFVASVQGLLGLAGIDVTSADAYAQADALLERQSVRFVPGRIARAIVARRALPTSAYEPLRRAVLAVQGDPTRVAAVAALADRLAADAAAAAH